MQDEFNDPLWRTVLSGAQMLFVAFGALVLMPLITGLDPNVALFTAGLGTILFQIVTGRQVPVFLASSFAFITPIILAKGQFGLAATSTIARMSLQPAFFSRSRVATIELPVASIGSMIIASRSSISGTSFSR